VIVVLLQRDVVEWTRSNVSLHDPRIVRPERRAPQASTRLVAFAKRYAKRESAWEKAGEELRQERDEAIRAAYGEGLPMTAIARIMGMSHQRVSQIVRR
jgi:DNA-directed RNA polymerase specialized sigma subunit